MQPYFFPYIGYFQLIYSVDTFIFYDDVNYIQRGWINRNRILINGAATYFTVPLTNGSQNNLISEVTISNNNKWQEKTLKSIQMAYTKAPFFKEVYPMLQDTIYSNEISISELAKKSIYNTLSYLDFSSTIIHSSSIYKNQNLKGEDRIIDICIQQSADQYINPIGGRELYNPLIFKKNNIKLNFIKPKDTIYSQFKNNFQPWLSIIDVIMFNSKDNVISFLKNHEII